MRARGDRGEDRQPECAADPGGAVDQRSGKASLAAGTPALAAVVTPTKTAPTPNESSTSGGSRSVKYDPCR